MPTFLHNVIIKLKKKKNLFNFSLSVCFGLFVPNSLRKFFFFFPVIVNFASLGQMRRSVNIHCGDDDDAWRWCLLFQLYSVGRLNTCKKTFVIRIYASLLQWYIHMYLCDWLGQNNRKFNKQHSMQMPDGFLFTLSVRLSCS